MIKNWIEFIKESSTFEKSWKLDPKTIKSFFLDLVDYKISVLADFNFYHTSDPSIIYKQKFGKVIKNGGIYHRIMTGEVLYPMYLIDLSTWLSSNYSGKIDEDLIESLLTGIDMIKDFANSEIFVSCSDRTSFNYDSDYFLKYDELKYLNITKYDTGGLFFTLYDSPFDNGDNDLDFRRIIIFAVEKNPKKINSSDIFHFYKFEDNKDAFLKDGKIYLRIGIEDLSETILRRSSNSEYLKVLEKGCEALEAYYDSSDYRPDIKELLTYILDNENLTLIIKNMIKEQGIEQFIENSDNDELENKTEEQIIDYLLNERYKKTLEKLLEDEEVIDEIKSEYSWASMHSHMDENYDNIINAFDDLVEKYFSFTKEIVEDKTYYNLELKNEWLEKADFEVGESLYHIWSSFCYQTGIDDLNLNPRLSDFGYVERSSFNQEIKHYLK